MDVEAPPVPAPREKWWQGTTVSEKVALGTIVFFFSLMVFLSGQKNFQIIPSQILNIPGFKHGSNQNSAPWNDTSLKGLISSNFDKRSCLSRFELALYQKSFPYVPSAYLLQKLRNYEALQKRCGPNTPLYRKSIKQLNSGHSMESLECSYVVWIPHNGLGNRILSLTSTFLYAILTDRVFLIQQTHELFDLFCEPFPDTSWVLPPDFPIKNLQQYNVFSDMSYGNMLNKHVISNNNNNLENKTEQLLPSYVYIHLVENYHDLDKLFFCNDDQVVLGKVNWLLLRSDLYFVPSIYSTPLFEQELNHLFPSKASSFYLLSHYLIHPSNSVWGMVTKYYKSYLAKADEKIGIQVRVFPFTKVSSDVIFQQILKCSKLESVLPGIGLNETATMEGNQKKSTTIMVVSLYAEYYERFKSMYNKDSVKTDMFVNVHQPSHEERQNTGNQFHNQKALAEIYLLSLCDVLMTSGWSTFGYVGYGLAGIKPVILMPIWDKHIPDVPCVKEVSVEPCHLTPPKPSCKGKTFNEEKLERYVKQCPDDSNGIKLFDN